MKVSIIIPAYNCDKYISSCLDSVLHQEEEDIEVIVVDDGSTDGTSDILEDYAKRDNRLQIIQVENGGPSRARNIGLENATGEWILFVDADDWVDADILSSLNLNEKSPDIIFFGLKKYHNYEMAEVCRPELNHPNDLWHSMRDLLVSSEEYFGYSFNKIYKRSIIENYNIRFTMGLHWREDEAFALSYCRFVSSMMTISSSPYNYRILENSLSHDYTRYRNYRLLIETEKGILTSYPSSDFKESFIERLFEYYLLSIRECILTNRKEAPVVIGEAVEYYKRNRQYVATSKLRNLFFGFPINRIGVVMIHAAFSLKTRIER